MVRSLPRLAVLLSLATTIHFLPFAAAQQRPAKDDSSTTVAIVDAPDAKKSKWKKLIEADSLKGWEVTNFGGEGTVELEDGVVKFGYGDPLTGITLQRKDFPKENFEIRWKAMRVDGSDFFAGVTFPVGDEHCSLICGGWGGGLVGLSSINGNDASENETTSFRQFKNKQWYDFRVQVNKTHVTAWIDQDEVLKVEREKGKFGLRAEVLKSRPLGYCVFQSLVELKDWEYQVLD
jgi:hypothetical protein